RPSADPTQFAADERSVGSRPPRDAGGNLLGSAPNGARGGANVTAWLRGGLHTTSPLPGLLGLAACGIFAAGLAPISDHAWQFYMGERMLDGARLYADIGAADMHPPLFTWAAMLLAAL